MTHQTAVVVIGGGYAGVLAANRLTQHVDVDVTLLNPRADFVERIRLHQLIAGNDDAVVAYRTVLATRVRLVVGEAARIDASGRRVVLTDGTTLGYDYLVYAVGSQSGVSGVPGAAEYAYPLASHEEAERLKTVLDAQTPDAPVTVVGGGLSGIETAAELAERGRPVTLVCGALLGPSLHPAGRRFVADRLARLGVKVLDGPGSWVARVERDAVELGDGRRFASPVTIWTTGFTVPDLARRSGLSTDETGRLLTDESLTSVDDPRIVAAGDAAAPSGVPFRMSCQAAGPLGAHAADTVLRRIAREAPEPVALGFVGQCLSLGRRSGMMQLAHRDDTARRLHLGGWSGARIKQLVCWSTVAQLRLEARRPGTITLPRWAADPARTARVEAQRTAALVG